MLWVFYYPVYLLGVYFATVGAFWTAIIMGYDNDFIDEYKTSYTSYYATIKALIE